MLYHLIFYVMDNDNIWHQLEVLNEDSIALPWSISMCHTLTDEESCQQVCLNECVDSFQLITD